MPLSDCHNGHPVYACTGSMVSAISIPVSVDFGGIAGLVFISSFHCKPDPRDDLVAAQYGKDHAQTESITALDLQHVLEYSMLLSCSS